MTDRGGYGSVAQVLFDGPDFQDLPAATRWVFVIMKLTAGPSGIWVEYGEALVTRLHAQSGHTRSTVNDSLARLVEESWIQRERNLIWIVEQLRYNPHFQPTNPHHRRAVQKHIGGLPRLPIVRRFVDRYPEYFGDAPAGLVSALPAGDAEPGTYVDQATFGDLFAAGTPQAESGKDNGGNGIARDADSLSHSLSGEPDKTEQLAYEVGRFCQENDCKWRLKASISEWAHEIRHDPKYAGVQHAYEVRRCNEWHQGNNKSPKAPDRAIRNWLENAVEFAARRFRQEGERPTVREDYDHLS